MSVLIGMHPRTRCSVPGCNRTTKLNYVEWVCGKCWSRTSRVWRRRLSRLRRRLRVATGDRRRRLIVLDARVWCRLRNQAIERAVGL
jgi:hypothetical protein